MRFCVIGDKDTVTGFSLAGIEAMEANSKLEAVKALKKALNKSDISIILMTERLAGEIQPIVDELYFQRKCTLILRIPDIHGALQGRRSVEDFVLSALGVKV